VLFHFFFLNRMVFYAALTMLDLITQKSSSSYVFYRDRLPKGKTYFGGWNHFFVVPSPDPRTFLGDNLLDPEGSRIRLRIPPPVRPASTGPVGGVVVAPADAAATVDPVFAATAARGEAAAAAATRPILSSSARVIDKGKRKLVMKPRPAPPAEGKGFCSIYCMSVYDVFILLFHA
jgi:hypothetical protein